LISSYDRGKIPRFSDYNQIEKMLRISPILFITKECNMFKEWWSTIPSLTTKRTATSNYWTGKKTATYIVGNPCRGLGQAQQWGGVKPANGIPTLPSW
jgi:hypothetical protein